jgi:hypothetical protein
VKEVSKYPKPALAKIANAYLGYERAYKTKADVLKARRDNCKTRLKAVVCVASLKLRCSNLPASYLVTAVCSRLSATG